jgi:hypothetical protein
VVGGGDAGVGAGGVGEGAAADNRWVGALLVMACVIPHWALVWCVLPVLQLGRNCIPTTERDWARTVGCLYGSLGRVLFVLSCKGSVHQVDNKMHTSWAAVRAG